MSDRSPIYAASSSDAAEVQRALRICLAGMKPPATLTFQGGTVQAWAERVFLPVLAPHVIAVHGMAQRGDAGGIIAADAALRLPSASAAAGRELLAHRSGARHLPVSRRFAAAIAEGGAAGHFATVLALHAADFSVAVLPLLQCLLYCEWHAGQPADAKCGMGELFHLAVAAMSSLPALAASPAPGAVKPAARTIKAL